MRYPPNRASCPAERSAIRLPSRAKSRFAALHAQGASPEVGQKACYGGGTLAADERVPTDGAAKSKRSQWGDAEMTNGIGGLDVQRGQVGPKPEGVQAVLTLVPPRTRTSPSSSLTLRRYRTATSPASGKRCSVPATRRAVVTPSMSMVQEIRTGWLGHAGTAPSRRHAHQGAVEQHGLCRWSVASR